MTAAASSAFEHEDSDFLEHGSCESCGSSDANALYSDGHWHCFSCGAHTPASQQGDFHRPTQRQHSQSKSLIEGGEYRALKSRGITEETCRRYDYRVAKFRGEPVHVATFKDEDGNPLFQKVRTQSKDFVTLGGQKANRLFGQHLFSGGKKLVITEGEIDCLTVSQLQGNKWPVVSIPSGAGGAAKVLNKNMQWLLQFEEIILMFDQDDVGREAVRECGPLFPHGRCFVAKLPGKDPNKLLMEDRGQEVISAMWKAKAYRPDELLTLDDIKEEALTPAAWGYPWPWPTLTRHTYGRRRGEVYTLGAGTGIGKTDVFTQIIAQTVTELELPVGIIYLEQSPKETAQRIAGKVAGERFHVPDAGWTHEQLQQTLESLSDTGRVNFYGSWGQGDIDAVETAVRFWAAEGVRDIFLDHLTALAAGEQDERKALEEIMARIASLANELEVTIYLISHLATPEGKPHEEGGRVMIRHFKGSRAIGYWSFLMIGLERNQQAEDPEEAQTTYLRVLKDRYTGQATGLTVPLGYNSDSGILYEKGVNDGTDDLEDDFENEDF